MMRFGLQDIFRFRVATARDRSFLRDCPTLLRGEVLLQLLQFWDCTKENARYPLALENNHVCADSVAMSYASSHDNRFSNRVLWYAAHRILTSILKNEGDSIGKILPAFLNSAALSVSARYLRAVGDVPIVVSFNNRRELVVHNSPLPCTIIKQR